MGKKYSNDINSKSHNRFISLKKSCVFLGNVSTKAVNRIVKFQILDFCHFVSWTI